MKNILYILSVVAVGAAAFTGWQVSDKTKGEIQVRDERILENKRLSSNIDRETKNKATAETERDTSRSEKDTAVAELDSAKSNAASLEATLDDQEARLEEQSARVAKVDRAVAQLKEQLDDPNIELADVPAIVEAREDERKQKDRKLEELELIRSRLEKAVADTKSEISRVETKIAESKERISNNTFSAVVSTVNNDWGFIVINAGEASGLAGDTKLLLTRDGHLLGRVLVSSLEANQAIAEIVPGSFAAGARAQSGDVVILEETAAN